MGLLLGANQTAFASAGCDAVNSGGFNASQASGSATVADIRTINSFAVGDKIDFSVNNNGGQWWLNPVGGALLRDHTAFGAGSYSYTVTGAGNDTNLQSVIRLMGAGNISVTATCTPVAAPQSPQSSDSQKLRSLQIQGSTMAAQASGVAITESIHGAIGDAFGQGGHPAAVGSNGVTLNFAADPGPGADRRGDVTRRTEDAFAALAYAGGRNITKAPLLSSVFERRWSLWADIRGSGFDKSNAMDGTQVNVTAGVGYKVAPNLLLGVFGGYEDFRYDFTAFSGKLKGDGGTVGGYAAWQIAPALRWDAMLGRSSIGYHASAGTASGSFDASRWLVSTGLTGFYRHAAYVIEPSARVYALWESQDAWRDSLGTPQAARDFSVGRVSLGGRVIAPSQYGAFALAPYLGFYGDWRFSSDDAVPVNVPNVGLVDGWSGRVIGGVAMTRGPGSLSLGGEYGGIGAGYSVWTGKARASWVW